LGDFWENPEISRERKVVFQSSHWKRALKKSLEKGRGIIPKLSNAVF
jgi:hypothetical protein